MTRSNLFANVENLFEFSEEKEIIRKTQLAVSTLIGRLVGTFGEQRAFLISIEAACLGVASKNGELNSKEKALADATFVKIFPDANLVYNKIAQEVTDSSYSVVEVIAEMGNYIAFDFLYIVLGFAYIDGKADDQVMNKLDEMLGMNLLALFMQSESEVVPTPQTRLVGLEAEIYNLFKSKNKMISLNEVATHFPDKSKTEIKTALDSLCDKAILFGGENFAGCRYGLV